MCVCLRACMCWRKDLEDIAKARGESTARIMAYCERRQNIVQDGVEEELLEVLKVVLQLLDLQFSVILADDCDNVDVALR